MDFLVGLIFVLLIIFIREQPRPQKTTPNRQARDKSKIKGEKGEAELIREISKLFSRSHIITNAYIPNKTYGTTEVDIIAIDKTGVYVFESKNYNGVVHGDLREQKIKITYPNRQTFEFFNPVRQNYKHTESIKEYLNIGSSHVYSYVVFGKDTVIGKLEYGAKDTKITVIGKIGEILEKDIKQRTQNKPLLSDSYLNEIRTKLLHSRNVSQQVKDNHIIDIQSKKR